MPTDKERRKVARRLRSLAGGYVTIGEMEDALGICMSSPTVDLERDARDLHRLADLIEPDEPQVKRELKYRSRCDELGAEMKRQRDALLKLADEIEIGGAGALDDEDWCKPLLVEYARRIREALGVEDGR